MDKFELIFGEMYNLFKEALLNDEEFIKELRSKLGNEEHKCKGNCDCDGDCGDKCKCKEEDLEDVSGTNEKFVMTNSNGEELIDADELKVFLEDEQPELEVKEATPVLTQVMEKELEEDEESVESQSVEDDFISNFKKAFGFAEATEEDLNEAKEEEFELNEETLAKLQEALESGNFDDLDLDIDLGDLLQQLKLVQQQPNYKFMERTPEEYDKIIEQSFGVFPADLGGNDEF